MCQFGLSARETSMEFFLVTLLFSIPESRLSSLKRVASGAVHRQRHHGRELKNLYLRSCPKTVGPSASPSCLRPPGSAEHLRDPKLRAANCRSLACSG